VSPPPQDPQQLTRRSALIEDKKSSDKVTINRIPF
jgi:hypothetical protein